MDTLEKIALIASGPSFKYAPILDPTWKIWINAPWLMTNFFNFADLWFEMHTYDDLISQNNGVLSRHKKQIPLLKEDTYCISVDSYFRKKLPNLSNKVIMQKKLFNNSIKYPLANVINTFGKNPLTSSASFMLAYAILCNPKEIGVWGIHMNSKKEYKFQREGFEYLLHCAIERNIKISMHESIDLSPKNKKPSQSIVYAYDWASPQAWWRNKK